MMDGIHDLGGKQGFGPIPVDRGNDPFRHEWEKRMWAMARAGVLSGDITIDWFRHGLECMVPSDYLAFPYFQKWCTNYFMLLVDNGTFTLDELRSGKTDQRSQPPKPKSLNEALDSNRAGHRSFEVAATLEPKFKPGDAVRTRRHMDSDHTRLPAYARGAQGEVLAHRGNHLLPDKGVHGVHEGEHLYTVVFTAPELWGDGADSRDSVALELWESYLVPA